VPSIFETHLPSGLTMRTEVFRVSRLALAYLAVAQYVRTYWWFVAIIPAFGLVTLAWGSGVLRAMGLMALLWPMSLPARAIFATSKAGKLLERGAWASVEEGVLYLHGEEGKGLKMSLSSIRRTDRRRGFFVLVLPRGDFAAVPLNSAPPEFFQQLEREIVAARVLADSTDVDTENINES
jgi:hypothetical protein